MDSSNKSNTNSSNSFFDEVKKVNYQKCSNFLFRLNPYEYSSLAYLVGLLIAPALSTGEQNSLGNWFQLLGQTIETIASQTQLHAPSSVTKQDFDSFKQDIISQMDMILKKK